MDDKEDVANIGDYDTKYEVLLLKSILKKQRRPSTRSYIISTW